MFVLATVFGIWFCYLLFGPFIREARRACKALEARYADRGQK